jgi:branched-chain amino acid transport system permease protein
VAACAGILLGIPVLPLRGDYLAIVTLGFGEIIRVLAMSDLLKPVIGGPQGVLEIPAPYLFGISLKDPRLLYYLILAACLFGVFVSIRLNFSRIGRAWIAMREDEDVAQAMGINLVAAKLMAFSIGAALAGIGGAIFASRQGAIFPADFTLFISINVLCLIIIGGIGSIPGTIVGALFLVGLPEVLRELDEYRILAYGLGLIVMMIVKPEGLLPSARRKMELHEHEDEIPPPETTPMTHAGGQA